MILSLPSPIPAFMLFASNDQQYYRAATSGRRLELDPLDAEEFLSRLNPPPGAEERNRGGPKPLPESRNPIWTWDFLRAGCACWCYCLKCGSAAAFRVQGFQDNLEFSIDELEPWRIREKGFHEPAL